MIPLIDTHIHFDDDRFDTDREKVYKDALEVGVQAMIVPATTRQRWQKVFDISKRFENVFPTAGLHPVFINEHTENDLKLLDSVLGEKNCVAIGECGLDKFVKDLDYKKQSSFFEQHLELAIRHKLPLIIHARNAVEDVINMIKSTSVDITGVVHSFNGSVEQGNKLIDRGFLLSFGGAITHNRATRLHKVVTELPLESILVETDAPDQTGAEHAGERNEPAYLQEIVNTIAKLKKVSSESVALQSNTSAIRLFKLPITAEVL